MLIYYIFSWNTDLKSAVMHSKLLQDVPIKDICKVYISEFRIKSWKMIDFAPWLWYLVEILEILLFYILSCDACKFAINLFYPSADSHLKMLIYYIFSWECRFEMAVMCLILQETP